MIRWEHLDTAVVPDGGGELRLMRRGGEFSIMAGGVELMSSRMSGSEEALATLSCARLAGRPAPHILIGGLGMGFTLRAALAVLPPQAVVTVAELIPQVVAWARAPMAPVFGDCLDDARVHIREADVAASIAAGPALYDAILLDVDNGPEGLTRRANDRLYDGRGLAAAKAALRARGVLAVWSSAPDQRFTARLRQAGFAVDEVKVSPRSGGKGRARHVIWLATRPD